jgi:hypothetical protein
MGNAGSDQVLDDPTRIIEGPARQDAWILEGADPNATVRAGAVTGQHPAAGVSLDQHEVPFPQPDPRSALLEGAPGLDWRRVADRIGGRPIVVFVGMTLLAVVFAAFISRNSQSLTDDLDARLAEAGDRAAGESNGSTVDAAGLLADSAGSEAGDGQGRSTGAAGEFDLVEHYNGQLIEPDDELTTDMSWVTTTLPATTVSTTVPSSTEPPSSTVPTTSTTQPETTTTTAPPSGPVAVAVSPGRPSSEDPELITSDEVRLQAEGRGDDLQYRFFLYRWDERRERWELEDRSRWRRRSWVELKTGRYVNETVRWTVMVRDDDREESPESAPLYFRVEQEQPEADQP